MAQPPTVTRGGPSGSPRAAQPLQATQRRNLYRLAFAIPTITLVLVFFAGPFIANGVLSFMRWTGFSSTIRFTGFDNFRSLMTLGILQHATIVTVAFALITMIAQNVVGLALAKALQDSNRINTVFRTIFFIPVLMSPLAAGYIWSAMLAPDGPINQGISLVIPGDFDHSWLGRSSTALIMVGFIDAWKWSGLATLVYIAGLNGISRSVIEAAKLDGASAWERFRMIEVPLLAPAFTFNITITLIGSFSA